MIAVAAGFGSRLMPRSELEIKSLHLNNGSADILFRTFSGRQYTVEYSMNLNSASWLPFPTGIIQGTGRDCH